MGQLAFALLPAWPSQSKLHLRQCQCHWKSRPHHPYFASSGMQLWRGMSGQCAVGRPCPHAVRRYSVGHCRLALLLLDLQEKAKSILLQSCMEMPCRHALRRQSEGRCYLALPPLDLRTKRTTGVSCVVHVILQWGGPAHML